MTDRLIKGVDFCSVHQHCLSCLSEGTQFLAAKHSHSSLSFIFSLYFSKLIIKIFHFRFKYFESQFLMSGTSWVLLCTRHARHLLQGAAVGRLPSALLAAGCWVTCKIVTFQDTSEAHKAGTLHLESSAVYKPCQAATACACLGTVTTQSWLCHGNAGQACGRFWCWGCSASLFCPWLWHCLCSGLRCSQDISQSILVQMQWLMDWNSSLSILTGEEEGFELLLDFMLNLISYCCTDGLFVDLVMIVHVF